MNLNTVKRMQKEYGIAEWQKRIENGMIWKFEGSVGRQAMDLLRIGVCFLPKKRTFDYWGNTIPSRSELKEGTQGTRMNAIGFWKLIAEGDIDAIEYLETL